MKLWRRALERVLAGPDPLKRLTFSATARCPCGAGLAYRGGEDAWDCSEILIGTADTAVKHTARLPFVFYEVKSEGQASARGATTRPV